MKTEVKKQIKAKHEIPQVNAVLQKSTKKKKQNKNEGNHDC